MGGRICGVRIRGGRARRCKLNPAAVLAVVLVAVSGISGGVSPGPARAAELVIGVGAAEPVHYSIARALCRQLRRADARSDCTALRIAGRDAADPLAVLSRVRTGAIEIGLVRSDWQYYAVKGTGPVAFMDVKFDNLRTLFSLHAEPFTLVVRRDSGIRGLDDLPGKRINIGEPGSGRRAIMEMVMAARGWTRKTFQLADELGVAEQSLALCHDRVQAFVATRAHPDPAIAKALTLCDATLVPVRGPAIDAMVAKNRFFARAEIPGGVYAGVAAPVATFGVTLTVVSSADVDSDDVYALVRAVFDDLDRLKRLHPALVGLSPARMIRDGLSAPPHPGATRYFRENGMM